MTGLRERNKARRREAILDAALDLLRAEPLASVTTERVAALAEVSPATVYNLVGTREQLLLALIDRVIGSLVDSFSAPDDTDPDDPITTARHIVDQSAQAFIADSVAYRQIIRAVRDFAATRSSTALDPAQLQVVAMRDAKKLGIVRADLDPAALGRQIYLSYLGALFGWSDDRLTDAGFLASARHGLIAVVAAAATDEHRSEYLAELKILGEELIAAGWARWNGAPTRPRAGREDREGVDRVHHRGGGGGQRAGGCSDQV